MMLTRYTPAIVTASAITLGLLFFMQMLIALKPMNDWVGRPHWTVDWVRPIPEQSPVKTNLDQPSKEDLTKHEPLPKRPTGDPGQQTLSVPKTNPQPPGPMEQGSFTAINDGPLVSLVRVAPVYPARAITLGLEGYVIVEFNVLPSGYASDVRVIESSHPVFEKAARNAAARLKYKPRIVDGNPQTSFGVRNRFTFTLDD